MVRKLSITVGCVRQTLLTTNATLPPTSALALISILDLLLDKGVIFWMELYFVYTVIVFGGKLVLYLIHIITVILVIHVILIVVFRGP